VALSTAEAELIALCDAVKHCVWLRRILLELSVLQSGPTLIHEDNQAAIAIAQHDVFHSRSRHIDLRYFYVRERLLAGDVRVAYCRSDDMLADLFTKPLGPEKIRQLVPLVMGTH
jgi:hypothetical protein